MIRFAIALAAFVSVSFGQSLPAIRWVHEIDNSGLDSFSGIGADAQGNTYVAGSTLSPNLPVTAAIQSQLATAGVYRVGGPGAAYSLVGSHQVVSGLAVDPLNPNIIFGVAHGNGVASGPGVRSVDGGNTWTALSMPSSIVQNFAVDPSNDQNVYAAAFDIGFLKSTDQGNTWALIDNGITACSDCSLAPGNLGARRVWVDPNSPNVLFASYGTALARSADAGASWQVVGPFYSLGLYFQAPEQGVIYVFTFNMGAFRSTDDGQTFQPVTVPVTALFADPARPGRLLGNGTGGIFQSTDDGITWTLALKTSATIVAADWAHGYLYAAASPLGAVRISSDLSTSVSVGPATVAASGLAVAGNGLVYLPNSGGHNVFVTKLDPSGNTLYSTYFGGGRDDVALAMAVDSAGGVYVTGSTASLDFPTTKGAYSTSPGGIFLFKLNPDGSVAYSTYFPAGQSTPQAIAVDNAGSAYISGYTNGGVPTTPGAYQPLCACMVTSSFFFSSFYPDAFLTKFNPSGSALVYSTYLGVWNATGKLLTLAASGSAYIAGTIAGNTTTVYELDPTGSSLQASAQTGFYAQAMGVAPDGGVYLAGNAIAGHIQPTPGAFQTGSGLVSLPAQAGGQPSVIVKLDGGLRNVLAATYFGEHDGQLFQAIAFDPSGNVYLGGYTAPQGLPSRTPLVEAFGPGTGFLSELPGDLSTLLFSSYLGDAELFSVGGIAMGSNGSVLIGGATGGSGSGPMNVYLDSLALTAPPSLRIDAIQNAASVLDGPLSPGETIMLRGAGFGSDSILTIGDAVIPALSIARDRIAAVVPANLPNSALAVRVQSGAAASNSVLVPAMANASPGLFSADGSGYGQGYILNKDGTRNGPSNPAAMGDKITIFATGVGPVSFTNGYAVTASPVSVYIDGFYCNGVAAVMGPVAGFPGSVYQLTVLVPNPASLVANNPNLKDFTFPPLVGIRLQVGGGTSQSGLAISIAQ